MDRRRVESPIGSTTAQEREQGARRSRIPFCWTSPPFFTGLVAEVVTLGNQVVRDPPASRPRWTQQAVEPGQGLFRQKFCLNRPTIAEYPRTSELLPNPSRAAQSRLPCGICPRHG